MIGRRQVDSSEDRIVNQWGESLNDSIREESYVTIVASSQDPASQSIFENLMAKHHFLPSNSESVFTHPSRKVRVVKVEKPGIYVEPADLPSNNSSLIFASKHVSSTNKPALTVHATGNLTRSADFGGKPEEGSFVDPQLIRQVLRGLRERVSQAGPLIDVTMEATHHGPTSFPAPVCFVEIGSGQAEWKDSTLGRVVAHAIMDSATHSPRREKTAVGFGGTHYSTKFTRICMEGDYAVGHFVPRHAFEAGVADSLVRDSILKTVGGCDTALVDWKGLSGRDRGKLVSKLEGWGYNVVRC